MSFMQAWFTVAASAGGPTPPAVNLRAWKANICGIRVPGLPPVPGGPADPSLVLSWFLFLYGLPDRLKIYSAYKQRGYTHLVLSWPDARAQGWSLQRFVGLCVEVQAQGFACAVMLASKDFDSSDPKVLIPQLQPVIAALLASGVRIFSLFWEGNLWLSPEAVAALRDTLCPPIVAAGGLAYVHFSGGVFAWQKNGEDTAAFWNASVNLLNGILYQRNLAEDFATYLARIPDGLERFAGRDGFVTDCGAGHPFDYVAFETSAELQFNGQCTEAQGDAMGAASMAVPPQTGPTGVKVAVIGFGNGSTS